MKYLIIILVISVLIKNFLWDFATVRERIHFIEWYAVHIGYFLSPFNRFTRKLYWKFYWFLWDNIYS